MANEGERPTSADKGKGKVDDVRELNSKKPQKDEKAPAEGKKKDEEPQEGRSCQARCTEFRSREPVASAALPWDSNQMLIVFKMSLAKRISN